ncbi:aspartate aminotransferase family protein [Mycobacterium spongiae]|uniref:Aminotransferase class III-fold pyridoxal phosphate-dependent enzyme n=1 Tax=Mycobacterium spongiae TaxID=886343 RepID=A0A975K0Y6_9MYCO|nr:aminotransferase class III-fold pyridoxal phosphate-dependent enzyme [Mycobacterium spongiae]QUR69354.1 aminotransferase class III-fold pyridoxal phosphate-dependent enzyme [Mycobacterium spongiae]
MTVETSPLDRESGDSDYTAQSTYFDYPPYATAAESDKAFGEVVSTFEASLISSLPLNVHYGRRDNARVQDAYTGRWYWDCHREGSKYNLGHRNPAVVDALHEAIDHIDAGNFSHLSGYRAMIVEKLVASTGGALPRGRLGLSGSDAVEIAVHAARAFTQRKGLVAIADTSYHGSGELGTAISAIRAAQMKACLVDGGHTTYVPYNDLAAMKSAITTDTAAVIMEPTPAQAGFPEPSPGYLAGVKAACEAKGALMILDEIQTGFGSTGTLWAYEQFDFVPDLMAIGKGMGGGMYPISATLMADGPWRAYTDGQLFPHDSTYAGSEIGCVIASVVLDLTNNPGFLGRVGELADRFKRGFAGAPFEFSQVGLCMGIQTGDSIGTATKLAEHGILTIPSDSAPVVPFRPFLTLRDEDADDIIERVRRALG